MGNMLLLREKIEDSGMTITAIAAKCNVSRETLYNKMRGDVEFKASEIRAITEVLHLTKADRDDIFFAKSVN